MLTETRFSACPDRRTFFTHAASGFASVALSAMLAQESRADGVAAADRLNPLAEKIAQPATPPTAPLPKGGVPGRTESLREVQQINQLIEQIRERNNNLCGVFPYL